MAIRIVTEVSIMQCAYYSAVVTAKHKSRFTSDLYGFRNSLIKYRYLRISLVEPN